MRSLEEIRRMNDMMVGGGRRSGVMLQLKREDCRAVLSGLVVRYKLVAENLDGEISASCEGVTIQGYWPTMTAIEDIRRVARMLEAAHLHYLHLYHQCHRLALDPGEIKALTEEEVNHYLGDELVPDA